MENKKDSIFKEYKKLFKEAFNDLKTKGRRHRQIPNILTVLRLTAPFSIIPAAIAGNIPLVVGLTIGFGVTDLADGFIARNWNLTSKLGADLDTLADKIFAGTLLLAASVANPLLLINVGLEMAIAGINVKQRVQGKEAASTLMGKIKTGFLFTLAGAGLLSSLSPLPMLVGGLAIPTTALQVLTVGSYLKKYHKQPEHKSVEETEQIEPPQLTGDQEEKDKTLEKTIKPKENNSPTLVIENQEKKRLSEMRDFLIHEKELSAPVEEKEEPKTYKKN